MTNDNGGYKDWEIKPFNKVFTTISSNSYAREKLNYKHGNVYNIHYGDVLIKYGANLDVKTTVIPLITNVNDASKAVAKGTLVTGDIVIADAAEDETAGKATEIVNQSDEQIVAGLHTIACKPKEGLFEPGFLGYYLNSPAYHNQIFKLLRITKVLSINHKDIIETTISVPDKEEQQKIADFLSDVDNQIENYQQSLDNLESQKRELLRQVFSQELRFTKDDGGDYPKWIEKELGSFIRIKSGSSPTKLLSNTGTVPYFKVEQLNASIKYLTNSIYKIKKDDKYLVKKGSIVFPKRGESIKLNKIRLFSEDSFMDTNLMAITLLENNAEFVFYSMVANNFSKIADYTNIPQINNKHVIPYKIKIPCPEEQQKIADFFSDIDNRIELERQRLQTMLELKKGLLQQMFC